MPNLIRFYTNYSLIDEAGQLCYNQPILTSIFSPKFGLLDLELNRLTKALFLAQVVLSVVMVALQGFVGPWFRNLFRFVVLFSYIIPIRYSVILIK